MALQPPREAGLYFSLPTQHTRLAYTLIQDNGHLIVILLPIDLTVEDKPEYLAISYTWGDSAQIYDLDVIGLDYVKYTIKVTQSAITAMTDVLRLYSRTGVAGLYFWIDQVCIDQSSDSEKIEQIRMMKDIYSNASMVLAWLGNPSEESDVGMTHIARLFDQMGRKQYLPINGATVKLTDIEAVLGSADDSENTKRWQGVLHILHRPYFLRGWILQEATGVNEVLTHVICGSQAVPLLAFSRIHSFLRTFEMLELYNELPGFLYLCHDSHQFDALNSFSYMRSRKNGEPLVFLARRIGKCNVTDPRDRLACMLSFATDVSDSDKPYKLDYSRSFQETYTHFAMWSICKYSNLDIFSDVAGVYTQNQHLPSWVPDWSCSKISFIHREVHDDHASQPLYAASGRYLSDVQVQLPVPSSPTILRASGIYLSIIYQTIPLWAERDGASFQRELDFSPFFCELNNCSMTEVFERTRCADIAARFDETSQGMAYSRRGGVGLPQQAEAAFDSNSSVETCIGKTLFLVHHPDDHNRFLMGICPDHAKFGDQIWMLKGEMLYILRPREDLPAGEGVVFDTTGEQHCFTKFAAEAIRFELIGEAFMLGLMDGEIVDMMGDSPLREPPPQFRDMNKEFTSEVYLI